MRARHARTRLTLLSLALALASQHGHAMGLGEAEVHSYIGMPLQLEIPLRLSTGESADEHCISLETSVGPGDTQQPLPLEFKLAGGARPRLKVASSRVAREPYATFRVRVNCGSVLLVRDYAVLLDPPPQSLLLPTTESAAGAAPLGDGLPLPQAEVPAATPVGADPGARSEAAPATPASPRPRSARHAAGGPGAAVRRSGQPELRLETGSLAARRLSGSPGGAGEGTPVLRLDMHMDAPPPVTATLVTQRAQLRDLRALMLSGDDTLERLLALQAQVGALETQLKSLQGGSGAPAPAVAGMQAPTPAPAGTPTPAGAAGLAPVPAPGAAGTNTAPGAAPVVATPVAAPAVLASAPGAVPPPPKISIAVHKPNDPPPPAADDLDWLLPAGGAAALLVGAGALLAVRRYRLRRRSAEEVAIPADESAVADLAGKPSDADPAGARTTVAGQVPSAAPVYGNAQSDEQAVRAAYLAQRFPEMAAGLIQLHDADTVVNGARLYVESGDHDRAEELLEVAIQDGNPNDIRPWLGLFEVHRMRHQVAAYADLLARFRERFATSRYMPEVLAVGRTLDPSHPEFAAPAGAPPGPEIGADGTTWLNPELDFVPQALAQDLHDTLMAELSGDELSLVPTEDRRT